jgi:hypothetical protein
LSRRLPSSREQARHCLGQCLPVYPSFRTSWQMGIGPCSTFPVPSLKFRTAGFPQYGFKPVVNGNLRPRASARAYMPPKLLPFPLTVAHCGQSPHCVGVEAGAVQAHRSRGPWLGVGLFCPVASSLTMASSELLARSSRLIAIGGFAGWSLPCGRWPEGPCFQLRILPVVPLPVPRRTGWPWTIRRPSVIAFARMRWARRPRLPT